MRSKSSSFVCLVLLLAALGVAAAQAPQPAAPTEALLTVNGAAGKTLQLSAAELAKLPRQTVKTGDRGQKESTYEGVSLTEVLRLAGAPLGDALGHHEHPTWYVVIEAKDGYQAVFALAELDPAFTDRLVLLADRKDGKPLAADEGPLRLLVPGDKRHARWVHQVTGVRLGRL